MRSGDISGRSVACKVTLCVGCRRQVCIHGHGCRGRVATAVACYLVFDGHMTALEAMTRVDSRQCVRAAASCRASHAVALTRAAVLCSRMFSSQRSQFVHDFAAAVADARVTFSAAVSGASAGVDGGAGQRTAVGASLPSGSGTPLSGGYALPFRRISLQSTVKRCVVVCVAVCVVLCCAVLCCVVLCCVVLCCVVLCCVVLCCAVLCCVVLR
jgi:hypothetical protein